MTPILRPLEGAILSMTPADIEVEFDDGIGVFTCPGIGWAVVASEVEVAGPDGSVAYGTRVMPVVLHDGAPWTADEVTDEAEPGRVMRWRVTG